MYVLQHKSTLPTSVLSTEHPFPKAGVLQLIRLRFPRSAHGALSQWNLFQCSEDEHKSCMLFKLQLSPQK